MVSWFFAKVSKGEGFEFYPKYVLHMKKITLILPTKLPNYREEGQEVRVKTSQVKVQSRLFSLFFCWKKKLKEKLVRFWSPTKYIHNFQEDGYSSCNSSQRDTFMPLCWLSNLPKKNNVELFFFFFLPNLCIHHHKAWLAICDMICELTYHQCFLVERNMTFLFTLKYSEQSGLSRTWIKDSHFCFMWLIKKSYFVPSSSSSDTLRGRFIYISYIIGTFKRNILISHFSWNVFWKNKIQEPA